MENFSTRLKSLRTAGHLRQVDLAHAIGLGQTTVANYEQNIRFPDEKTLIDIADYFEVSLDYLLGRSDAYVTATASEGLPADESTPSLIDFYFDRLLNNGHEQAFDLIIKAATEGMPVRSVYTQVFEPALKKIGLLWETGEIDVAKEHYFSEATEVLMAQLRQYRIRSGQNRGVVVCLSVSGENHRIGMKMISDIVEEEGWKSLYLGVNTPTKALIGSLEEVDADILALSATMEFNVDTVSNLIYRVKSTSRKPVKIIAGGQAFNTHPELWKQIGADGYAADLHGAIELMNSL